MAQRTQIQRVNLTVTDCVRGHYANYPLTLAQHPSETELRVKVRLLAFALNACEDLTFGPGLCQPDEAALHSTSIEGHTTLSIELGQPDPARLKKACIRSDQVVVYSYDERSFKPWWEKNRTLLEKLQNLSIYSIDPAALDAWNFEKEPGCLIIEGQINLEHEGGTEVLSMEDILVADPDAIDPYKK